ncbi:hypothetical protein GNF81_18140, partial [Clostridium perfringens]|nr:hypothetical protein [Clostridium perfringens]
MDYKIELWVSDKYGYKSDSEEVYYHVKGAAEIFAKSASATSEWGGGVNATNTINRSGISGTSVENYIHDNNKDAKTMWHTRDTSKGVDITYDFGMIKSVDQMHVWNMNQMNNADRGLKNVKIEYSLDNENWQTLTPQDGLEYLDEKNEEYPFQLTKASGENGIKATNLNTENHEPV